MANQILLDFYRANLTSGLDQTHICAVVYCTKLQELKYKNICLELSALYNVLNVCMHVHTIVSSLYKIDHNYSLHRIIIMN
jgi:hypothetical protein